MVPVKVKPSLSLGSWRCLFIDFANGERASLGEHIKDYEGEHNTNGRQNDRFQLLPHLRSILFLLLLFLSAQFLLVGVSL